MDVATLLVSIICLLLPSRSSGAFSFDNIEDSDGLICDSSAGPCSGPMTLLFNYTTGETVTVIEWYKQPGVLIARIFGVNTGAPFTVLAPYNAPPYTVTQYQTFKYNAAIQITGLSASDTGVYSVNVTAASPQSAVLFKNITASIPPGDKPIVSCNSKSCTPPATAVGVTTVWTKHGDRHRCTLQGGNAACSCAAIYAECRDTDVSGCHYCLLALLVFIVLLIVQLVLLLVIKFKEKAQVDTVCFIYHHLLVFPLFGWLSFIPSLCEKGKFDVKNLDYGQLEKILINVFTTVGVVLILILQFVPWSDDCEVGIKFGICMLVAVLCCGLAILVILLRYFCGCKECGNLKISCKHEPTQVPRKVNSVSPIFANLGDKSTKQGSNSYLDFDKDPDKRHGSLPPLAIGNHGNEKSTHKNKDSMGQHLDEQGPAEQDIEEKKPRKEKRKTNQKQQNAENKDDD